ncbi:hypothetical protein AVEN_58402-1 [Araneus ventricosus]|uniref:DDE-1 domain-containing protein n=1 Tax=Araneus ventricosus TaxID=182803 RepID=A0A4Y2F4N9_ARAVE|nr:hypothetical protein AVEN_58402-1 [Araneus ventricosus]
MKRRPVTSLTLRASMIRSLSKKMFYQTRKMRSMAFKTFDYQAITNLSFIKGVRNRALTSAWKKLWQESVVEPDFEGCETTPAEPAVNELVLLANIMVLEVENDIDDIEEDDSQRLRTEELMDLHFENDIDGLDEDDNQGCAQKSLWICIVFHSKKLWRRICQWKRS